MTTSSSTHDDERTQLRATIASDSGSKRLQARKKSHETGYDIPNDYGNIDEAADPAPIQNPDEHTISRVRSLEGRQNSLGKRSSSEPRKISLSGPHSNDAGYNIPDNYANLDELATQSLVANPREDPIYQHKSLEEAKNAEKDYQMRQQEERGGSVRGKDQEKMEEQDDQRISRLATQLYTLSYLILFSFLGTLARLGLQSITFYPGAPIAFSELWANFGGSVFMGFLSEDRMLFKEEWGTPTYDLEVQRARKLAQDEESGSERTVDLLAAKKAHASTKKTIPLYIARLPQQFPGMGDTHSWLS
ncbi:Fluoride export 1 [Hyphodiscus hymeniophilus]|uniref:Fluoride export 1 n=1 Tax=Hyphodiscus hymeniophilus TaxID=353542 RepID=A0A9P6VIB6_9HELO|nr:Fluoride export 1 [Hyphodiscus hymeniophilus]